MTEQSKKKTTKKMRANRQGKRRQRLGPKESIVGKIKNNLGVVLNPMNIQNDGGRGSRHATKDTELPF